MIEGEEKINGRGDDRVKGELDTGKREMVDRLNVILGGKGKTEGMRRGLRVRGDEGRDVEGDT